MSGRWNRFREKFRRQPKVTPGKTWKNQPVGTKVTSESPTPKTKRRFGPVNMNRHEHFVGRRDPLNKQTRKKVNRRRAKNKMARRTRKHARNMNRAYK